MTLYRSPMEKILRDDENLTVVTNPNEPIRTFFRKLSYRLAVWKNRLGFRDRRSSPKEDKGAEK